MPTSDLIEQNRARDLHEGHVTLTTPVWGSILSSFGENMPWTIIVQNYKFPSLTPGNTAEQILALRTLLLFLKFKKTANIIETKLQAVYLKLYKSKL